MKLSEVLRERGYVYQHSSEKLEEITDGPKRTLYLGIDPSADSLQVGQLQAFLILRRFLEDGHRVILLTGGGTGMIGDPGGKNEERPLLDTDAVRKNSEAITAQAKQLFGSSGFDSMNNADWLLELKLVDFLRETGKHFTVNEMMRREMIKERIENPDQSISYTEFSYMLLQSYDYWHLHEHEQCDLQVGGSDQWGNIVSGVDYIRRKTGHTVYAFTWPLLVNKSTGRKFGKSEQGTVWLDVKKTSPFQFYQFWLNSEDDALEEYFLKMTMLPKQEIEAVLAEHKNDPSARIAQRRLAYKITELVHGLQKADLVEETSRVLFEGNAEDFSVTGMEVLKEEVPTSEVKIGEQIIDILIRSGLASSKREAKQFIDDGAISLNANKVLEVSHIITKKDFSIAPIAILKRGKRNACVLVLS